ncbi:hypothetical protein PJL18_03170 [Paenarthrobacter nicotinovorans]|nr:hypothetical protein [Paenarthrobacter nicotinovorans]
MDHRCVEQEAADILADRGGLAGCHAQEHFELDALGNPALLGQEPGEGNIEEVVTGDADADGVNALRGEGVVDDVLVAGVRVLLGAPGSQRPVVQRGFDLLHGEVGTLDDADLDGCATFGATRRGPLLQFLHGTKCVRQVGLEDNAGFQVLELRHVQDALEHRDGHAEVLVFLHVQVDELGLGEGRCEAVERGELLNNVVDGFVEGPRGVRGNCGGFLDGDVVNVLAGQQLQGAFQTTLGFVLAQDGFAEEVHVQVHAVLADLADGRTELGVGGVNDQVAHHLAEHAAGDRDDNLRQDRGQDATHPDSAAHVPGKELGNLRGELGEFTAGDRQVLGADDAVDESNREVKAVRVLQDAGEALGGDVHGDLAGFSQPVADQSNGFLGQSIELPRFLGARGGGIREGAGHGGSF